MPAPPIAQDERPDGEPALAGDAAAATEVRTPAARRAPSTLTTLKAVELVLEAAHVDDALVLHLSFENVTHDGFGLSSRHLSGADFELGDADGDTTSPVAWSPGLEAIVPPEGFAPGVRRSGTLTFPRPRGREPFELRSPVFESIVFRPGELPRPSPAQSPEKDSEPAGIAVAPKPRQDDERWDEINALLARQARAMERFDMEGYLETFVPSKRNEEREVFLRMRLLPLSEVRLELRGIDAEAGPRSPRRVRVEAELLFRLQGLPSDNPFVHALGYTVVTRGEPRVESIADSPARPLVWRRGELTLDRTNHFLIYAPPVLRSDLVHIATEIESAYAELYRQGLPMASGYVVYLVADPRVYAEIDGFSGSLGVAQGRYSFDGSKITVDSRTFYVNASVYLSELRRHVIGYRQTVVAHELVHLALAGVTHPATPPWLKEGAAVFFSNDISYDETRELVHGGLPRLSLTAMTAANSLVHADLERATDQYLYAGNVVAYLVEERGRDRFLELYRSYLDPAAQPDLSKASSGGQALGLLRRANQRLTAAGLRRFYGLTLEELDLAVKEWMRVRHP